MRPCSVDLEFKKRIPQTNAKPQENRFELWKTWGKLWKKMKQIGETMGNHWGNFCGKNKNCKFVRKDEFCQDFCLNLRIKISSGTPLPHAQSPPPSRC